MGDPIDVVYGTRLARLCCKGCVKKFKADPAAMMAKVDAALIEAQKASYPMSTCVVSGEELQADETIDYLYGTQLVRFCCKSCIKAFEKDPNQFVSKVKMAQKGAKKAAAKKG